MRFTLLNTRPPHQADLLNQQLAEVGVEALNCPSLQIETEQLTQTPRWDQQDVWVFVSRNAVTHFALQLSAEQQVGSEACKIVAVGEATAQAIGQQGWPNLQPVPSSFDSEGMLSLAVFNQPQGLRVGVVRGDGGREHLAQTLRAQGAQVSLYEVYRRQISPFCQQAWRKFKQAARPILLFTSGSSLQAFLTELPVEDQAWCFQLPLIVFSQRLFDLARQAGFTQQIYVTSNASDAAICELMQQLGAVNE